MEGFKHTFVQERINEPIKISEREIKRQILPTPTLHVFGGGHVGKVTAQIAVLAGFQVLIYDDREYLKDVSLNYVDLDMENQVKLDEQMQKIF